MKQMKMQLGKSEMNMDSFSYYFDPDFTSSIEFTDAQMSHLTESSNYCRALDQVFHETAILHVVLAVIGSLLHDVLGQKAESSTSCFSLLVICICL